MMKLTHKAIAMMCGYYVEECDSKTDKDDTTVYWCWTGIFMAKSGLYNTEQEAWEACCTDNGFVEEE